MEASEIGWPDVVPVAALVVVAVTVPLGGPGVQRRQR